MNSAEPGEELIRSIDMGKLGAGAALFVLGPAAVAMPAVVRVETYRLDGRVRLGHGLDGFRGRQAGVGESYGALSSGEASRLRERLAAATKRRLAIRVGAFQIDLDPSAANKPAAKKGSERLAFQWKGDRLRVRLSDPARKWDLPVAEERLRPGESMAVSVFSGGRKHPSELLLFSVKAAPPAPAVRFRDMRPRYCLAAAPLE